MRTGPSVRDRRDAWTSKDAVASGPWGSVEDPATASGRGDRPRATASGLQHMGIAGGRRRAGAPCGTAGDLGSMAIVPHQTRRGPSDVTGTAVTVSGPRAVGGRVVSTRTREVHGAGS